MSLCIRKKDKTNNVDVKQISYTHTHKHPLSGRELTGPASVLLYICIGINCSC